jgi:hypothetical protein
MIVLPVPKLMHIGKNSTVAYRHILEGVALHSLHLETRFHLLHTHSGLYTTKLCMTHLLLELSSFFLVSSSICAIRKENSRKCLELGDLEVRIEFSFGLGV